MTRALITPEDKTKLLDTVLERYSAGEQIGDFAKEYELTDVSIYRYLLADRQDEFRQAQVSRAMGQFELAAADRDKLAQKIIEATDQLELNKASVLLKHAEAVEKRSQWLLERCLARIYGQEKGSNQAPVAIQINLERDKVTVRQSTQEIEG